MTAMQEVPLPDMPEAPTLWAVHIQGPDDVIATVDRSEADQRAGQINDWYTAVTKRPDFDAETFPRVQADVIEWPFSPAAHAEDVARGDERWNG